MKHTKIIQNHNTVLVCMVLNWPHSSPQEFWMTISISAFSLHRAICCSLHFQVHKEVIGSQLSTMTQPAGITNVLSIVRLYWWYIIMRVHRDHSISSVVQSSPNIIFSIFPIWMWYLIIGIFWLHYSFVWITPVFYRVIWSFICGGFRSRNLLHFICRLSCFACGEWPPFDSWSYSIHTDWGSCTGRLRFTYMVCHLYSICIHLVRWCKKN